MSVYAVLKSSSESIAYQVHGSELLTETGSLDFAAVYNEEEEITALASVARSIEVPPDTVPTILVAGSPVSSDTHSTNGGLDSVAYRAIEAYVGRHIESSLVSIVSLVEEVLVDCLNPQNQIHLRLKEDGYFHFSDVEEVPAARAQATLRNESQAHTRITMVRGKRPLNLVEVAFFPESRASGALLRVCTALVRATGAHHVYVPYRDSHLTKFMAGILSRDIATLYSIIYYPLQRSQERERQELFSLGTVLRSLMTTATADARHANGYVAATAINPITAMGLYGESEDDDAARELRLKKAAEEMYALQTAELARLRAEAEMAEKRQREQRAAVISQEKAELRAQLAERRAQRATKQRELARLQAQTRILAEESCLSVHEPRVQREVQRLRERLDELKQEEEALHSAIAAAQTLEEPERQRGTVRQAEYTLACLKVEVASRLRADS